MWVDYGTGRTEGSFETYAEAEPRLRVARKKLDAGEITPKKANEVINKIFGEHRKNTDWAAAVGEQKAPKGNNPGDWERGIFEEWLRTKPLSYLRVYHSPGVVARFVLRKDEQEELGWQV